MRIACAFISGVISLPVFAEEFGIPARFLEVTASIDSGHPNQLSTFLAPFNGQRTYARSRVDIHPPENFVPCYVQIEEVHRSADAGYKLETLVENGKVNGYRLIIGATGEDFPSWAGHDVKIRFSVVSIQSDFAVQEPIGSIANNVEVLRTSTSDAKKISCPLNSPQDGQAGTTIDGALSNFDGAKWEEFWLGMNSNNPPGCPVYGWYLFGAAAKNPDPKCANIYRPIPAPQ
jgi:hypothetical protein